jgi:NADH-quinone oxidoreductase subunit K
VFTLIKIKMEQLTFYHECIYIAIAVFLTGFISFIESNSFLKALISIEVMMLGCNFHLITTSIIYGDPIGQVYALCMLAITAAETAVGLGLLILMYRTKGQIRLDQFGIN